jgi:hypothetical protein
MRKVRVISSFLIIMVGAALAISQLCLADNQDLKITQVVYLTTSKACGCTLKMCKFGDRLVDQIFTDSRTTLLKRIDYARDQEAARGYIRDHHLYTLPALLFLDARGNLLGCLVGELKKEDIINKLNQFGA